jgi:hypothetical protein
MVRTHAARHFAGRLAGLWRGRQPCRYIRQNKPLTPGTTAAIPLFYFDEALGKWKQEGTATLKGDAAGLSVTGQVDPF